jgi:hypothetical protein
MWHFAQRAEISEEICMLIARQRFLNQGYIDGVGYKRKVTDNFAAEARKLYSFSCLIEDWENKYPGYRGTEACIR